METPQLSSCSGSALFAASRKQLEVKKWDGSGRTDICWDALRKVGFSIADNPTRTLMLRELLG